MEKLLQEYEAALTRAATTKRDAALAEINRAAWVNGLVQTLVASGKAITPAKDIAHADERHRDQQREVAGRQYEADIADRDARVLAFQLKLALAQAALDATTITHLHKNEG